MSRRPSPADERGSLAHDLKTPLSVISGYAELLRVRNDAATQRDAPLRILEAAERLSRELDRLLELLPSDEEPLGAHAQRSAGRAGRAARSRPPAAPATARSSASAAGARRGRRRTVALVDDDPAVRRLLRATLPDDEYEVLESENARDAMETIDREAIDLVILDWLLPDGTGGDVLAEAKARRPDLPVIVLTAGAEGAADAADALVTKPFSPLELLDLIERLLRRG